MAAAWSHIAVHEMDRRSLFSSVPESMIELRLTWTYADCTQ
jgi:hypothetical protein